MKLQNMQVLGWLERKPITPLDAIEFFGCLRLAARIHELRQAGYSIVTLREPGERYARYVLQRKKRAA